MIFENSLIRNSTNFLDSAGGEISLNRCKFEEGRELIISRNDQIIIKESNFTKI